MDNTQQRVLQYMSPVWWLCNGREEGGSCPVVTAVAKPEIVYRRKTARTTVSTRNKGRNSPQEDDLGPTVCVALMENKGTLYFKVSNVRCVLLERGDGEI